MVLKPRPLNAHKGLYGHVLLIAGSRRMVGAACLAALGAMRSGAGLVTLATPHSIQPIAAGRLLSAMTVPLPETETGMIDRTARTAVAEVWERATAVVIGPGIGQHPATRDFLTDLITHDLGDRPAVIDADGLNVLADRLHLLCATPNVVLTPHPKEFSRLSGQSVDAVVADPAAALDAFFAAHQPAPPAAPPAPSLPSLTVVLKTHRSVVGHGDRRYVNRTGNPGLATGGTGDVLAGLIGGLLAQGHSPFLAAKLGTFLHGYAGDLCAADLGMDGMIAEDLIPYLPTALKHLRQSPTLPDTP